MGRWMTTTTEVAVRINDGDVGGQNHAAVGSRRLREGTSGEPVLVRPTVEVSGGMSLSMLPGLELDSDTEVT